MKKVLPPLRRAMLFLSPLLLLVLGFLPRGMKSIYMLQQGEEWETVTKYGPILEKTNLGYHPWLFISIGLFLVLLGCTYWMLKSRSKAGKAAFCFFSLFATLMGMIPLLVKLYTPVLIVFWVLSWLHTLAAFSLLFKPKSD